MKKQIVLVRTKCDNWNSDHQKTIEEELANDLQQARQYYPACDKVIGIGRGTYEKIRPELQ